MFVFSYFMSFSSILDLWTNFNKELQVFEALKIYKSENIIWLSRFSNLAIENVLIFVSS